uniref:Cation/H+ exchanger transmembrane domain-containing protein n=1 Tax=Mola mola TaxID=94237 RepID=A0A3Q3W0M1_MOLML
LEKQLSISEWTLYPPLGDHRYYHQAQLKAWKKASLDSSASLVFTAVGLALISILSVWKLKQFKYRFAHETGGAMFYGKYTSWTHKTKGKVELSYYLIIFIIIYNQSPPTGALSPTQALCLLQENFDPQVLFNLFLPPIIFHGAYTLNQKRFMRNLGSVLTFAFLGTLISCLIIGACVYGFTRLMVMLGQAADGDFFLTDCLLFGAIISATDPVVDLLTELSVDLDLHTLLFGESVLNDAMAIVLTHSITTYSQMGPGHSFDPLAFFISVGYFLGVLAGSFILGFTFTLCENPLLQTSVFFLLSWSSFLSAEAIGLSGIVAVLFCGLSQARYTVHNLSSEGRTRTKQLYEVFNFLGEIFLFGYMGYVLLTFPHHVFKVLFIFGAFVSFSAKRPSIFTLCQLVWITIIQVRAQTYLLSGLRGAVAFNLAARDTSTEARRTILTTTLLLVSFTIWVLGTAADPVLRCLDIRSVLMLRRVTISVSQSQSATVNTLLSPLTHSSLALLSQQTDNCRGN